MKLVPTTVGGHDIGQQDVLDGRRQAGHPHPERREQPSAINQVRRLEAVKGGVYCLPVMELVTVLVGGHDVQQQDVLGLCVQTRQLKLHLREHLPNNQGNQTKAKKNTEGKKIIQKIKIH